MLSTLVKICSLQWPKDVNLNMADVPELARLAISHGVGPWVLFRIHQEQCDAEWAKGLVAALRVSRMQTLAVNTQRLALIRKMADALSQHGMPLVVLKGMCLAQCVFPSVDLRPTGDVDVLVALPDTYKAYDVLRQMGAQTNEPKFRTPVVYESMAPHLPALAWEGHSVELHFALFGGGADYNPNVDLAEHLVPIDGLANCVRLDDATLFAHLSLHIVKNWRNTGVRLGWLLDLALLLSQHRIPCASLFAQVEAMNPHYVPLMRTVWQRVASLLADADRSAVEVALGLPSIMVDEAWLRGSDVKEWGSLSYRLRRLGGFLRLSLRYVILSRQDPGKSRLRKFVDVCADYKLFLSNKINN